MGKKQSLKFEFHFIAIQEHVNSTQMDLCTNLDGIVAKMTQ